MIKVKLYQEPFFNRWIIVPADVEGEPTLAWSGSRFVPIAGDVQICNYVYPEQAREYAQVMGMTVVEP